MAEPTSISVTTFGTNKVPESTIEQLIKDHFDLRPYGIITSLDLLKPIYQQTAVYGHMGREDIDLTWERTDKADLLRSEAGLN